MTKQHCLRWDILPPYFFYAYEPSCFSHVWLFTTLWTRTLQTPLSKGLSKREYWSVLPCLPKGIFATQGLNPWLLSLLHWQMGYPTSAPWEAHSMCLCAASSVTSDSVQPYGLLPARLPVHQFSSVQSFSHVRLFVTPWTSACQAYLSITNSQSLLKLMSIESVMSSNYLILCHPLLLLPSVFPSIKVFSNESALHIRWPKYWSLARNLNLSTHSLF